MTEHGLRLRLSPTFYRAVFLLRYRYNDRRVM